MKYIRALLVTAGLVGVVTSPTIAGQSRTSFHSETDGAPASAIIGFWTSQNDGLSVRLDVAGGHAIGTRTRFRAEWVTPLTKVTHRPIFSSQHRFVALNAIGRDITFIESYRYRARGGEWSPWFSVEKELMKGELQTEGSVTQDIPLGQKARWRFQWRLRGKIGGPTSLNGFVTLSLRG